MAEPPGDSRESANTASLGKEAEATPAHARANEMDPPVADRDNSSARSIERVGEASSRELGEKASDAGDDGPTARPAERSRSTSTEPEADGGEPLALEKTATNASKTIPLEERSKTTIALLMSALSMATFLAALDSTIITTALPTIASELQLSEADYAWIGSSYMIASAAATPPWGKVSDIFGRKPILLAANIVFFVGSLICAVSINTGMLIAGRVIQGIGGGGLLSMVNICIADLVTPRNRGVYYGMIGGVWAVAGAVGPVLGGVFTQFTTWRWCFYINLPCDFVAFLILVFYLQIDTPKTPLMQGLKAIDWTGLLLIVGGVVMFLLGLEWGGVTFPWNSTIVICLIVFGIVTLALFFVVEWKVAKYPIMPLRLFKKRNTVAAFGVCMSHGGAFIALSYYLPLYFQAVLGATPLLSGVFQLPFMLGLALTSMIVGVFIRKTGRYREATWTGMALLTIGTGLLILLPADKDWGRIIPFELIAGLGAGPIFQSPLLALHANIEPKDIATGTATFAFIRQISGGIGLVIGGVIFQNQMANTRAELLTFLNPMEGNLIASGAAGAGLKIVNLLPEQQRRRVEVLYVQSLKSMWIFYTVVAGLGLAAGLMMTKKELSTQHQVRKQGLEQEEAGRKEELAKREKKAKGKSADV